MAYRSPNYKHHPEAPIGQWACAPTSSFGPFAEVPPRPKTHGPNFCGQCVSYVTTVTPKLPVKTSEWEKGAPVKGNKEILPGTVIATFNASGKYEGHAAIYVDQNAVGIVVYDQWVTGTPKAVGPRILRWGAHRNSNNGDNFFVVE